MQEKILYTQNLKLASVLCSFGISLRSQEPFVVIEDADNGNKKSFTFFFTDTPDGLGGKIMSKWEQGWAAMQDLEEPLAYCRAVLENRERLLDMMNNATPMVKKTFGKATLLVSKNANPELKRKLARYL